MAGTVLLLAALAGVLPVPAAAAAPAEGGPPAPTVEGSGLVVLETGVVDLTGGYEATLPGGDLRFDLLYDERGRLRGSAGFAGEAFEVRGRVKFRRGVQRILLRSATRGVRARLSGRVEEGSLAARFRFSSASRGVGSREPPVLLALPLPPEASDTVEVLYSLLQAPDGAVEANAEVRLFGGRTLILEGGGRTRRGADGDLARIRLRGARASIVLRGPVLPGGFEATWRIRLPGGVRGVLQPGPLPPPPPVLVGLAPSSGPEAGGTLLTLTGSGLAAGDLGAVAVTVGGVPADAVTAVDGNTLTCRTPPGQPGPRDVRVTHPNGTAVLAGAFSYFGPLSSDRTVARVWEPVTFRDAPGTTWDFGDGSTSTGAVVSHAFVLPGTYLVTADGGLRSGTVTVLEEALPAPTLRAQLPFGMVSAGMWAHGDLAFVPGFSNGIVKVVDVSDPATPVERATVTDAGGARGVRAWGDWFATAKEGGGNACDIYDVSDPAAPVKVAAIGPGLSAHNVGIWDNVLVLNGLQGTSLSLLFYDVSDPEEPVLAGSWDGGVLVHDSQRLGNRLYAAAAFAGFYVLDVSDPAAPAVLGRQPLPGYSHNVWPSGDGRLVFTTEENSGGHLKVWDVSDPGDIRFVGEWAPATGSAIIHNVVVVGDYAYIAYYTYGLSVLDVSDPSAPVEIFHHDTLPASDATGYDGAWMVYPFGDRVLVSDISGGLFTYTK